MVALDLTHSANSAGPLISAAAGSTHAISYTTRRAVGQRSPRLHVPSNFPGTSVSLQIREGSRKFDRMAGRLASFRPFGLVCARIASRASSPLLNCSFATLKPSARASSQSWDELSQPTGEWQSTLGAPVAVSGVGLHLGLPTTVTLLPAPAASGRVFHVVLGGDGGGGEVDRVATGAGREGRVVEIGADVWSVVDTRLCTVLAAASATPSSPPSSPDESPAGGEREQSEVRLGTVEHLLSALEGCGVDNCVIRVEGAGEMPLLDGSAAEWVEHIMAAGIHPATLHRSNGTTGHAATGDAGAAANDAVTVERRRWNLPGNQPITVQHGDSFIAAFPRASPLLTYGIDFPHVPAIGRQWVSWEPCRSQQPAQARAAERRQGGGEEPGGAAEQPVGAAAQGEHGEHGEQGQECGDYVSGIAPARTFCILEQVEQMRAAGLIRGGSLDNALVCSQARGWVNPPLRLPLEPCRHKLLDLIGDLALCARGGNAGIPNAHIVAYKASHALHVAFGKALMGALEAEAKGRGGAG